MSVYLRRQPVVLEAAGEGFSVTVAADAAMNYALAHNAISPLQSVRIFNGTAAKLSGLDMELRLSGPVSGQIAEPLKLQLPEVAAGETLELAGDRARWKFNASTFAQIDEAVTGALNLHVTLPSDALYADETIRLLARDEWWALAVPESLAAFVTPRARAIQDLLGDASAALKSRTSDPSLQGYQGGFERARAIAEAVYDAMRERKVRYINPPPSFEGTGQKIRSPHEVLHERWGTCLDLATTFAAAIEAAGLNPVIVLCHGHAFAGVLMEDIQLPEMVLKDRGAIQNFVDGGALLPIETVALCEGTGSTFEAASGRPAAEGWWSHRSDAVEGIIDVRAAHRALRPIPAVHIEGGVRVVEVERAAPPVAPALQGGRKDLTPAAKEPATRGGERQVSEFPPRVERWRNSLLDLSFRNPLLNMKTGMGAIDLHVPRGALGAVEDMIFDGQSIEILPHDQLADIHRAQGARTAQDIEPDELASLLREQKVLFGACPESSYMSRLRGLQRRAKTVFEETGANNLFLTLGTLQWEDAGRKAKAPLFLLPMSIRSRRGRPFQIQIDDGAYSQPNQCLLEKLRVSKGLTIPQFQNPESDESGIDLVGTLQAIRRALIDAELSYAVDETAHLAILQFSTLQLWQDLSENWPHFLQNPVVKHLVETPTDTFVDPKGEMEGVESNDEAEVHCPISIDGSQLKAVTWAETGRSFVLEGPPGTGKSQTITNLIANALAEGRKVLFVAEKQAALDVVKRRLDTVGLGSLCLDLHGKSQSPEKVRAQLRGALNIPADRNAASWDAMRSRLQSVTESLSRYPEAVHEVGAAGLSAWTARQSLLTTGDGPQVEVATEVVANPLDTDRVYRLARELSETLFALGSSMSEFPWRLSCLDSESRLNRSELKVALGHLRQAMEAVANQEAAQSLAEVANDETALEVAVAWAQSAAELVHAPTAAEIKQTASSSTRAQLETMRAEVSALHADASSLLAVFRPEVISNSDLDQLLIKSKAADAKFFKGKPRKVIIEELQPSLVSPEDLDRSTLTPTLEAVIAVRARSRDLGQRYGALLGIQLDPGWNALTPTSMHAVQARVDAFEMGARLIESSPGVEPAIDRIAQAGGCAAETPDRLRELLSSWRSFAALVEASPDSVSAWKGDAPLLGALRGGMASWAPDSENEAFVRLARWIAVAGGLTQLVELGIGSLDPIVRSGELRPDEIEPALRRGIASAVIRSCLAGPALAGFDGIKRDRLIRDFSADANEMREDMRAELPAKIVDGRTFRADRLVGKVGELSRELSRKRGGMKVRELFINYGASIGELTPCLMMSPHSVARFLPVNALEIDLVVFDEASQIKVAESIGAMGRANAAVVVGDSQQMPPSNSFSGAGGAEDEEPNRYLGAPVDMESVLSEAVESNLPRVWLSWHYRSKHEALITFSNERYYEGRLASFPRPPGDESDLGVSMRRVDGRWERGGAGVNREEASAIVEEVERRLGTGDGSSIGVVTFNSSQRDLIMDRLEESSNEDVAAALAHEGEPLFVKNLENVQGDERDVILFSLAFSPDPETDRLGLNFGPLTQSGGERRLNVAVTRARAQVVLFASFDPRHIDLSRTSSVGLAHLRDYMEMSARSAGDVGTLRSVASRNRHREEIVKALEVEGMTVRTDVGLSEFKVDLGVASGEQGPWVAVFLDGPDYASRSTVGDRECLPHGVLTAAMGWTRTERIWFPDWIRDRHDVITRIVRAVEEGPAAEQDPPDRAEAIPTETRGVGDVFGTSQAPGGTEVALPRVDDEHDVFKPAHDHVVGGRAQLDALGDSSVAENAVSREVADVIEAEGPTEFKRLARVVARRFDLSRVAEKRIEAITALVPREQIEQTPFGNFAWPSGQNSSKYDGFRQSVLGESRDVEEVAPVELLNAMAHLATIGGGIPREELLRETAGLFGIRRVTGRISSHLERVLDFGVKEGRLALADGYVSVIEAQPRR